MDYPDYKIILKQNDKENLEEKVLQLIKDINYDEMKGIMTPEQEELRESYLRSYNALLEGKYMGYDVK